MLGLSASLFHLRKAFEAQGETLLRRAWLQQGQCKVVAVRAGGGPAQGRGRTSEEQRMLLGGL